MNNQVSFDSLLRMAIRETYLDQVTSIPSEDEIDKTLKPSDEFKKKIYNIVHKEDRNEKLIHFRKTVSKVAVIVMVCISLTSASLLSAEAVRESVAITILEWHDKFTKIFIETDTHLEKLPEIKFNYIPEGFELVENESFETATFISLMFRDKNLSFLRINVNLSQNKILDYADNERSNYFYIKIQNNYCLYLYSKTERQFIFSLNNIQFNIAGEHSIEELVRIYKNIEIL